MALNTTVELDKLTNQLREWLKEQQKFPQDIENKILRRFLHSSFYDVEKAKHVMERFFTMRTALSEVLTNRDPLSPDIQKAISFTKLAKLEISGKRYVWIFQLDDPGLKMFDYLASVKLSLIQSDTWLLEDDMLEEEDILIFDVKDISIKILTKFNLSIERTFKAYQQEALPVRLKEIHFVNVPSFFTVILSWMKPFLNKEVKDKLQFHSTNSETLFNFFSKEDLPEELGGTNGIMEEHTKNIIDGILRNREYFLKDNMWTISEEIKSVVDDNNIRKPGNKIEATCNLVID